MPNNSLITPTNYSSRALYVEAGPGIHKVRDIISSEPGRLKWGHIHAAIAAGLAEMLPDLAMESGLAAGHCDRVRVFF